MLENGMSRINWLAYGAILLGLSGCSTCNCLSGIETVPAYRVPREIMGRPRSEMMEISMQRLRQTPPKVYQLAPNDVLGIYIENVLGSAELPPPVNFPEDSSRPPSLGFPVPVREDGTLALPLVEPIQVSGLTLAQATEEIRRAYTVKKRILPEGKDRIIVTLQRPREYRVLVIREESGNGAGGGAAAATATVSTKRGTGATVFLPAYENDLLTALTKTGGLPGVDAENEVLIIRGNFQNGAEQDQMVARLKSCKEPCECDGEFPNASITRVPLRFYPEQVPTFKEEDIILKSGDIVMVQSRDREQFYMGGVLRGAHAIPRDYDLNILQAISIANGQVGAGGSGMMGMGGGGMGGGGGGGMGGSVFPPTRAIVVRKLCNGSTVAIRVNTQKALTDPTQQVLVQPEDLIILQYTISEEIANVLLRAFNINYIFGGGLRN